MLKHADIYWFAAEEKRQHDTSWRVQKTPLGFAICNSIQVVPHKAVVEVSKTGNQ